MRSRAIKRMLIIGIAVLLLLSLAWEIAATVDGGSVTDMARWIQEEQGIPSAQILTTDKTGRFLCALYSGDGRRTALSIWEASLLPGRFRPFGGGSTTESIGTYNFNQSGRWSLIIIYGSNHLNAASYTFANGGKTYGKDSLGSLILDVYILQNTADASSHGRLNDAAGNTIGSI